MRTAVYKPYRETRWSLYGLLVYITKGKTMPLTIKYAGGENSTVSKGKTEDGINFFTLRTTTKSGSIAVSTIYEDGTIEETYER